MQCVKSVLLNKIVSSEKDLVGVVLYGTVCQMLLYMFSTVLCAKRLEVKFFTHW